MPIPCCPHPTPYGCWLLDCGLLLITFIVVHPQPQHANHLTHVSPINVSCLIIWTQFSCLVYWTGVGLQVGRTTPYALPLSALLALALPMPARASARYPFTRARRCASRFLRRLRTLRAFALRTAPRTRLPPRPCLLLARTARLPTHTPRTLPRTPHPTRYPAPLARRETLFWMVWMPLDGSGWLLLFTRT